MVTLSDADCKRIAVYLKERMKESERLAAHAEEMRHPQLAEAHRHSAAVALGIIQQIEQGA